MNCCLLVLQETVLSLNENSQEHVCSKEQIATEQETSAEGLILKKFPIISNMFS